MSHNDFKPTLAFIGLLALSLLVGCDPGKAPKTGGGKAETDDYASLSRAGKKFYDAGRVKEAIPLFEQAAKVAATNGQAHVNLANAYLLDGRSEDALRSARTAFGLDTNLAAAVYIEGCATLRLAKPVEAAVILERAKAFDPTINPVSYQLARAYQDAGRWQPAMTNLEEVVMFNEQHKAAHYNLGQAYLRIGRRADGEASLGEHRRVTKGVINPPTTADFERCRYTKIIVPFELRQPDPDAGTGLFVDISAEVLGAGAQELQGPLGVVDLKRSGAFSLFARKGETGFQLLVNSNSTFSSLPIVAQSEIKGGYLDVLVGDLNNDRVEDVIVLGNKGSHVFQFSTNGAVKDVTRFSLMADVRGAGGLLADLDYTGKLDLLLHGGTNVFQVMQNLGHPYFIDQTTNFVVEGVSKPVRYRVEDWNGDDMLDVIVAEDGAAPKLLARQRNGKFVATNAFEQLPAGTLMAVGDLDNDLKPDLIVQEEDRLSVVTSGRNVEIPLSGWDAVEVELIDFDNDGWLDLAAFGSGVKLWRNLGQAGFVAWNVGLDSLTDEVTDLVVADFDRDCDTDIAVATRSGGVRMFRNDVAGSNRQIKLDLIGTRSNASALGIRLELVADGLHLTRRIDRLPVEIGVGVNTDIDSISVHWFDFTQNTIDVDARGCTMLRMLEFQKQTGSCPYLYTWDGTGFRFVTDLLGGSPLGLPVSANRLIESEPDELVWMGDDSMCPPKDGHYVLQVTEELREVLYLDAAELVVVDHPDGTEVHTTGKLTPGKPFPKSEIVTLHREQPLLKAFDDGGREVTDALSRADRQYVSPSKPRVSQLRGLAEPYSVTLDYGDLDVERPLVLAISAWLRFGGASVNIGASHDSSLPFPFPVMEVELGDGEWQRVDVEVGAPAGKPKNYVVDLTGRLPEGSKRLRITTAFEIHWDRIALLERRDNLETQIHRLKPSVADLHWRGYGRDLDLPWYEPITPDYADVSQSPLWRTTPEGWCTRYGDVGELVAERDNALVVMNGGDELTLQFAASTLPSKAAGQRRDLFFYNSGWDKDADVHCILGHQVGPLPWHGMNDQLYGQEPRPRMDNDAWIKKYNTRFVGARDVSRGN